MSTMLLWVVCGLAVGGGIVGLVAGIVGTSAPAGPSMAARLRARPGKADRDARLRRRNLLTAGAVVGALLWLVTGVFILGVLVVLVAVGVPWLLSPTKGPTSGSGGWKLWATGRSVSRTCCGWAGALTRR